MDLNIKTRGLYNVCPGGEGVFHQCQYGCCYNSTVDPCCPATCSECQQIYIYSGYAVASIFVIILAVMLYCACKIHRKRQNSSESSRSPPRQRHNRSYFNHQQGQVHILPSMKITTEQPKDSKDDPPPSYDSVVNGSYKCAPYDTV